MFACLGSLPGNDESNRTALLVSPDCQSEASELPIIKPTSDKVWLVYRFHVVDVSDFAAAVALQGTLEVIPLKALRIESSRVLIHCPDTFSADPLYCDRQASAPMG